jgi:flagellar hook-basal body complex protein FliE
MTAKNKNAATKKTTTTTTNNSNNNKLKDAELTEQLNRAYTHVLKNQIQVQELHRQWRSSLAKLSFILVAIALHQARAPMHSCIQDIKVQYSTVSTVFQEE